MNAFEQLIIWLMAAAVAVGVWFTWGQRAEALDIEMKNVACYAIVGESVSKTGLHTVLLFNQCDPGFQWKRVPAPPDAEV